jgi:hypothetical protein
LITIPKAQKKQYIRGIKNKIGSEEYQNLINTGFDIIDSEKAAHIVNKKIKERLPKELKNVEFV